jgi:hypothetical protein
MNRFVRAATAALVLAGGLGSVGCAGRSGATSGSRTSNCIDPSWPDRYAFAARQAVIAPFAQQVTNGHFANQVVWNWYFEPGTDKLNGAGTEKLDSIARSTPNPDTKLFLQAARDLAVTPENTDKIVAMRDELTAKRAAAVHKYMGTQPGPTVMYELSVVDMPTPGIYAPFGTNAFRGQLAGYQGSIQGGGGGSSGAVGGGGGLPQTAPGTGSGTPAAGAGTGSSGY